jgi:hypothetical protein
MKKLSMHSTYLAIFLLLLSNTGIVQTISADKKTNLQNNSLKVSNNPDALKYYDNAILLLDS